MKQRVLLESLDARREVQRRSSGKPLCFPGALLAMALLATYLFPKVAAGRTVGWRRMENISERLDRSSGSALQIAALTATAVVIVVDFVIPLGLVAWFFYLVPLALTLTGRRPWLPIGIATLATLAIAARLSVDTEPLFDRHVIYINRAFGLASIWIVALVARQLVATRIRVARETWIRTVQARLFARLQGELTEEEVGEKALGQLALELDGRVGALYVRDGHKLRRVAGYAIGDGGEVPEQVDLGEGLVGQAARDGRMRDLAALPTGSLRVRSALVDAPAAHVVVAPLKAHQEVDGVLEIGKRSAFDELERELLERVSESVAIALRSAAYRRRLRELLDETQRQAEELQAQSEELRVSNEELEEQSRALRETQARLEAQQAELEETNAQLEGQTASLERQKAELLRAREDLSVKAAELARANRMKSEFLANMSHELRTPLNSSLILAKLLADNDHGNLTPDQVRYAETIYAAGNDLLTLINDILDLSKIEAGRFDIHPETVNVPCLLTLLQRSFEATAQAKGIAFRIEVSPSTPKTIVSDGNRLQQILRNLISNAVKFTERGEVAVVVHPIEGDRIAFEVRDTGIGIAEEKQALVFEPFTQADGTTSRQYGGTGLGLSIARQLALLLGGDLRLESTLGKGSTFTLTVPTRVAEGTPTQEPELLRPAGFGMSEEVESTTTPPGGGPSASRSTRGESSSRGAAGSSERVGPKERASLASALDFTDDRESRTRGARLVLVIEDDVAFARILYELAHESDFDCVVATTAAEGIEFARSLIPVGVLLDVRLPDVSGLTVLEVLKRDHRTRHIPVHVISAHDFTESALHMGALGYLLKPVQRAELQEAFRRIESYVARDVRRILVVEDSAELRENLRELLRDEQVQVDTVGTAQEALASLETQTFDCMVLDLVLPDASGFELLERMSEGTRYAFPPVIVYTGRTLSRDEELRLRRYSSSIIVKGARSPERLLDEVSLFLHRVESQLPAEKKRLIEVARDRESAFAGRTILVVEDDVRNVYALTSILEPRGAKVEIARNGREAIEFLDEHPEIDLVLMDTMMPVMDGISAMREIRKDPRFRSLPIISVTAKAMRDDQEQCMRAGASDYLAKPLEVEQLLSLCRVWLPK